MPEVASAVVPVNTNEVAAVMLSVLETPVSLALAKSGTDAVGLVWSILISSRFPSSVFPNASTLQKVMV